MFSSTYYSSPQSYSSIAGSYPDIYYIEGFGDYIKVVTGNAIHTSYSTLNKISELLPEQQFMRIHKSFIINLRHIQFVEGNLVRILDKELPLGITYVQKARAGINRIKAYQAPPVISPTDRPRKYSGEHFEKPIGCIYLQPISFIIKKSANEKTEITSTNLR